jgi:cytidine deaminase
VHYDCRTIRLSQLLHELPNYEALPMNPVDVRIFAHMDAGDEFRSKLQNGSALGVMAVGAIREERKQRTGDSDTRFPRCAYVLQSLKHPDEVNALRSIYGAGFVLLAVYSPRDSRLKNLAQEIAQSHHSFDSSAFEGTAVCLIRRDEADVGNRLFGQNVRDTFPQADVFVDASNHEELKASLDRFVELLFGYPFHTPTRDEFGMFHARASALRSAALGRQVGAAIATDNGEVIAVGANEVPKAGGGLYWAGDIEDARDFTKRSDTNTRKKRDLLADVLERLRKQGLSWTPKIGQVVKRESRS